MPPTLEQQRDMLRTMQTIRRFEERASDDYHAGAIYRDGDGRGPAPGHAPRAALGPCIDRANQPSGQRPRLAEGLADIAGISIAPRGSRNQ